jgi:hypothetical protein
MLATTPIIFPRCGPKRGKITGVLGNNAEKKHELELKQFSALLPTMRKIIGVDGNNVEHFSELWAAQKNLRCFRQQRGRIATMPNSATFFVSLSLLL